MTSSDPRPVHQLSSLISLHFLLLILPWNNLIFLVLPPNNLHSSLNLFSYKFAWLVRSTRPQMQIGKAVLQGSQEKPRVNPFISTEKEPESREGLGRCCQWWGEGEMNCGISIENSQRESEYLKRTYPLTLLMFNREKHSICISLTIKTQIGGPVFLIIKNKTLPTIFDEVSYILQIYNLTQLLIYMDYKNCDWKGSINATTSLVAELFNFP